MRPFAFQLSGGNFVVEFGAAGWFSESSKHFCASNLTGHKLCTLALPSHFSGFMGDKVRHVADGVSLPAFLSGRQNQC